jgi:hypothetical protein
MKLHYLLSLVFLSMLACSKDEPGAEPLVLKNAFAGDLELSTGSVTEGVPVDRTISLVFSAALDESTTQSGILLSENDNEVSKTISLSSQGKSALLLVNGTLKDNTLYTISINQNLKSTAGASTTPTTIQFKTLAGALSLISIEIDGETVGNNPRVQDIGVQPTITFNFSTGVSLQSFQKAFRLTGRSVSISSSDENRVVSVTPTTALDYIKKYRITLSEELKSSEGRDFEGYSLEFYTQLNPANKFPQISESELLTKVQEQTFKYFWDFAHPTSGLARERNSSGNTVTIGGSGFGVMAILVGIERGFISRQQGIDRLQTIVNFLKNADRFHGVWPHWMNGNTGKTIPFSATDDGGDLVETAFMIQGLLTVREYLNASNTQEKAIIDTITELWEEVEWDWHTRGGQNVLYWHWSPNVGWEKNLKIQGWNESLIVYVLAASSPTHPISANVYHEGWARNGNMANGEEYFGSTLPLGYSYGGPLFFSHYSFLGLDPRQLEDQYANYWDQNVAHSKINYAYAVANPKNFVGYNENAWGLTASDNHQGYSAHSPTNDLGVITPTAALSSFPYTPDESMKALKHFYYIMGDMLWGEYGFYDAFNLTESWVASSYLAIDQGPIVLMIENHRTGLLWNLFMKSSEITNGLKKLGFTSY